MSAGTRSVRPCAARACASTSNQSATSLRPSERAVCAICGYISDASYISEAIAAFRLLSVSPMGSLVAGSPVRSKIVPQAVQFKAQMSHGAARKKIIVGLRSITL
uniref:Uncharacterized protein n=1 Tax=Chrysotila carterae TaxID=13221 RepID=A0A7S4EU23_CHRCT